MKKRGQVALEFLMTYGWAIMVVLIAIGALSYFGVLSPDKFVPRKCFLMAGIGCADFKVQEDSVVLVLRNGKGEDITISSIKVGDCTGTASGTLNNGAEATFTVSGCNNVVGEKFYEDINISYTSESGLLHTNNGNIADRIEGGRLSCDGSDVKALWHLDESSGAIIDSSPCNNHGINVGATQGVAGKIGTAYSFNGDDHYVSIPASTSLDISGDITILIWVKPSVDSPNFHNSWNFFIYQRSPLKYETGYYNAGGPRFKPYNEDGTDFDFSADMEFTADIWYNVVFVRQGSFLGIYVNGVLQDFRNDFTGQLRSSAEVRIGGNGGSSGFEGAIDEVIIYNRALSASEILIQYQSA